MSFTFAAGLALCVLIVSMIALAAISDLRSMRISNSTSALVVLAYFAALPLATPLLSVVAASIGVALLVLAAGVALFCRGLIGGGDVKFAASLALWTGADHTLDFLFWTAALGGAFALLLLGYRALPAPSRPSPAQKSLHEGPGMPFAVPLAAAALVVLPASSVFSTLLLPLN